jgi:hypothetical protein
MVRRDDSLPAWTSPADAAVLKEALQAVEDATEWQLSEAHWLAIEHLLGELETAIKAGDADAVAEATADLELAGPLRIASLGARPVVKPPAPVLFLLNHLVYSLGDTLGGRAGEPRAPGASDDSAASR